MCMKKEIIVFGFFLITASCTTTINDNKKPTDNTLGKSEAEIKSYRDNCILKNIAIACAKYAYLIKPTKPQSARDFYKKACDLGDKNSCFNLESMDDGSLATNENLINSKNTVLYACYQDYLMKIGPKGFFHNPLKNDDEEKGKRIMHVKVTLNPEGKIQSVEVPGYDSQLEGVKCMERTLQTLHFVPSKLIQQLEYSFTINIVPYL